METMTAPYKSQPTGTAAQPIAHGGDWPADSPQLAEIAERKRRAVEAFTTCLEPDPLVGTWRKWTDGTLGGAVFFAPMARGPFVYADHCDGTVVRAFDCDHVRADSIPATTLEVIRAKYDGNERVTTDAPQESSCDFVLVDGVIVIQTPRGYPATDTALAKVDEALAKPVPATVTKPHAEIEGERVDYPNARDCEHGQLRRSCDLCERDKEIAELAAQVKWRDKTISNKDADIAELKRELEGAEREGDRQREQRKSCERTLALVTAERDGLARKLAAIRALCGES